MAGRKITTRRRQTIVKRYAFHSKTIQIYWHINGVIISCKSWLNYIHGVTNEKNVTASLKL